MRYNFAAKKLSASSLYVDFEGWSTYLGLQDIFYQTNDGEWDFDMNHSEYCPHCNTRPCVLEGRAEEIYYVFVGLRMEICTMRRKRLKTYKEFVRMLHGTLGYGVRVEIPMCCVQAIRGEFPKESDGEPEYTGFRSSAHN